MGHAADRQSSGLKMLITFNRLKTDSYQRHFQILDLSKNNLSTLNGVECLLHLKQLYANWNRLYSLAELPTLPDLHILSVSGNAIASFDGMATQVPDCWHPHAQAPFLFLSRHLPDRSCPGSPAWRCFTWPTTASPLSQASPPFHVSNASGA
jgi:hypothetical protein